MKTLQQIREASGGKEAYQKFFNSILKKFGVSSPAELEGDKKKEFYDAIDAGWEGDNEKPEANEAKKMVVTAIDKKTNSPAYKKFKAGDKRYIYKETYGDPDNLDPDTTMDADEEEINAGYGYMKSHKMNASYGKMHAGKMMASYHKESVNEKSKLKAGKGKITVDLNWDGSAKDKKFAETKYGIKLKITRTGALASGEKARVLAYVSGQDYAMDDEDIEDLMPEILESNYPKPLSIIRQQNEFSGDAETQRKKKRRFEDMVMCEQCGKMHEEGACMETDVTGDLDPETKGMKEMNFDRMLGIKGKKKNTAPKDTEDAWDKYKRLSKNKDGSKKLTALQQAKIHRIADQHRGDMQKAMKEIERLPFFAQGIKDDPYVLDVLRRYNESVNDYGSDKAVKAAKKKTPGQNEGVDVDRRTVGFKAAMVRNEKAKIKREKAKDKKAAKKDQAELDARYDYDGGVDDVLASANAAIFGTKLETAANAVAHGGVDMAPNAGKKKKDKEKIFARKY